MMAKLKILYILFVICCSYIFVKKFLIFEEAPENLHMLIISATYYNQSTLYPQNSVTILFNAIKNFSSTLYCISKNADDKTNISPLMIEKSFFSMEKCAMRGFAPNCLTVPNPTYFAISTQNSLNSHNFIKIPTRKAIYEKYPIVSCVSPLFFNEQWHMNILSIEYYAYFGVTKQAYYYMSILESGYSLLKEYENLGIIDLHPWALPNISEFRYQLDFRNQYTAHNDCFLLYREAADFIIAHDPDDLLIIKNMTNLWNSFASYFLLNPSIGNVMLERLNSYIVFEKSLKSNTNVKPLSNIKISDRIVWRKSFYLPKAVENINSHDASILHPKYSAKFINIDEGFFIHARNFSFIDSMKLGNDESAASQIFTEHRFIQDFLNPAQLEKFEAIYHKRIEEFLKLENFQNLTLTTYYHRVIDDCYEKVYYHNESNPSQKCPSHYYCTMPKLPGLSCIHSNYEVSTTVINGNRLTMHYVQKLNDINSSNGCFLN